MLAFSFFHVFPSHVLHLTYAGTKTGAQLETNTHRCLDVGNAQVHNMSSQSFWPLSRPSHIVQSTKCPHSLALAVSVIFVCLYMRAHSVRRAGPLSRVSRPRKQAQRAHGSRRPRGCTHVPPPRPESPSVSAFARALDFVHGPAARMSCSLRLSLRSFAITNIRLSSGCVFT